MKKIEKDLITKTLIVHKQFIVENKKMQLFFKNVEKHDDLSKILMIRYIIDYKKILKRYHDQINIMSQFSPSTKKYIQLLKKDLIKNNIVENWISSKK
jgi:hypothetical protein